MLSRHSSRTPLALASAAVLAVLALGGCDPAPGSGPDPVGTGGPSVIVPGGPGEANRTLSAEDAARQRADDDTPNAADLRYARRMIEHHAQALEMTRLAPTRAESTGVKRIAERITAAQGPEITAMESWLKPYAKDVGADAHEHTAMPGMATAGQLTQLRTARGKAFDELFLTLMIAHHEGAISMATEVKAQGNNVRIEEMADDVIAQQTSEITRMRGMREAEQP
ncbi:DUF305 domain-containing protein [Streptomyces adustus]|uniref:DUF305 domain-containing protein n=1 Tax=Streptomyces adustus TaxID=1609272 RepID=UPI0035D54232